MKKFIIIIIAIFLPNVLFTQTTLVPGDIAIIQYNADGNPEVLKFLALRSMEAGTIINFTDKGWVITAGVGTFYINEGVHTWTAASAISCGDIITVSIPITLGTAQYNLAGNGDQILAYQGTALSPTFIFAINNEGNRVWQSGSNNARSSELPPGLTDGANAVAIKEVDNVYYSGSLTGSRSTILSNICDNTNWNSGTTASSSNGSVKTFTGSFNSSSTWNGSAWSISGADYFTAVINGDYDTTTHGNFTTCNCTVNSTKTLTVKSGGTVTVEDDITNNGSILVESGGSVVQDSPSGTNTGTDYTVERATTSQSSRHVFTYWSSPITSATFAAVAADAHLYYSFNASSQSYVLGSSGSAMSPGIGYSLEGPDAGASYPGTQTASFDGAAFNNGDISVGLSFSLDGDADNDWNLVGNPYPSAIDADTFLGDNSTTVGGTIYFWTHNTIEDGTVDNTEDDYAMYNSSGGTAAVTGGTVPDGNIASTQGFFVQALANGAVSDFFTNKMRIETSNTSFFRSAKKQVSSNKDRVWLNLTNNNSFSQILVGFFDDATNGEDRKYDGIRFLGKSSLNFYSLIDDKEFGIQGLSSLKRKKVIPLGFSSNKTGTFKIAIDNLEGKLATAEIILFDKLLNVEHLLHKTDYEFTSNKIGVYNDRFELIIKPERTYENGKIKKINIYRKGDFLYVDSLEDEDKVEHVSIYTISGQVFHDKEISDFENIIDLTNIKNDRIYILKIQLSSGELIVKKMIF